MRLAHAVAVAILGATASLAAHHSLADYDTKKQLTLTVTVREFHFATPHPYLVVDARLGPFVNAWRLELDNRFELLEIGMTGDTFKRGDELVVSGAAGRDQKPIMYVRELNRTSDGFRYEQIGSTPSIVRPSRTGR
jgi:hypothetical protein